MEASVTPAPRVLTYQDLSAYHLPKINSESTRATVLSTLNSFLKFVGKSLSGPIEEEFGVEFPVKVEAFLTTKAESSHKGNRSRLNAWLVSYHELQIRDGLPETFHEALHAAMRAANLTRAELARKAGSSWRCIHLWLTGEHYPDLYRSLDRIPRVEQALGLPPNALLNRLPALRSRAISQATPYRKRLAELVSLEYMLKKEDFSPRLKAEWDAFYAFKTATMPRYNLKRNGRWTVRGKTCASARIAQENLMRFLGYLCAPADAGDPRQKGKGMRPEEMSLTLVSDVDLVYDYLEFAKQRTTFEHHNSTAKNALGLFKMLIHPQTGFLTQQPKYGLHYHTPITDAAQWREHCKRAHGILREYAGKDGIGRIDQTRNTEEAIAPLLAYKHPLDILLEMCDIAREDFRRQWEGRKESNTAAVRCRDLLIASMLTSNPLRQRNYREMTWKEDNSGNLHQKVGKEGMEWWLFFSKEAFKNKDSLDEDYLVPVDPALWPLIELYLNKYRPLLVKKMPGSVGCDIVFMNSQPSRLSGKQKELKEEPGILDDDSFGDVVRNFTAKFCPANVPGGFGPHSFRHLIATDYIRNHPEGYEVAAAILHDKPETVRANYSKVKNLDMFRFFSDYLSTRRSVVSGKLSNTFDISRDLHRIGIPSDKISDVASLFSNLLRATQEAVNG